jgi:Tfp pilus assembly protein PilO
MKPRDRLVVCVLVAAAGLAALWIGVVSPKRQDAAHLGDKLSVEQARLGAAQSQLTSAKAAEAGYPDNLRVVKSLYKAVPAGDGVPHLLVALDKTSHHKRVDFKVITVGSATPGAPGAIAPVAGGLSPVSFTFTFDGGYIDLQHFLRSVARYTLVQGNKVIAHGRLLTIKSVALSPPQASATTVGGAPVVSGTQAAVTATAYSQQPATSTPSPAGVTSTASVPATQTPNGAAPAATTPTTR